MFPAMRLCVSDFCMYAIARSITAKRAAAGGGARPASVTLSRRCTLRCMRAESHARREHAGARVYLWCVRPSIASIPPAASDKHTGRGLLDGSSDSDNITGVGCGAHTHTHVHTRTHTYTHAFLHSQLPLALYPGRAHWGPRNAARQMGADVDVDAG